VGPLAVVIDPRTGRHVETRAQARASIQRMCGADVGTGVFFDERYAALSGLICSRVDVANHPEILGADFQFLPNPYASVMTPKELKLRGTVFRGRRNPAARLSFRPLTGKATDQSSKKATDQNRCGLRRFSRIPNGWLIRRQRRVKRQHARLMKLLGRAKPPDGEG